MEWCVAIRRIVACSAALRRCHGALGKDLETLLSFLEDEDVLVAYAAKEGLRNVLTSKAAAGTECVNDVVRALVLTRPGIWRREASGFRFQLLRQLIRAKTGPRSVGDGSDDESGDEDEENRSGCIKQQRNLHTVLRDLKEVGVMVRSVLLPDDRCGGCAEGLTSTVAPNSVQYEALVFLSDFVKGLHSLEVAESSQEELSEQMMLLMDDVFLKMDYVSQPAFVSCAVLGLLGDFLDLVQLWRSKQQDDEFGTTAAVFSKWLERCMVWLMQSSCMSAALRMLNDDESSSAASQKAFIAESSRYPFLQQWLLYLTRMVVAFLEAARTESADMKEPQALCITRKAPSWAKDLQLPSRRQFFAVLAEQDDVMIEVLNSLTRIILLAGDGDRIPCSLTEWSQAFVVFMMIEYDPDLLFADLVDTLGQDHLVLLDLLVSNETHMLEYIMRYLRRLSTHWNASKRKLQIDDRLGHVMSVLIRLRLEIDRLVAVDMFPYGAGPLTRRLLAIEQLYEEPGDDVEQL